MAIFPIGCPQCEKYDFFYRIQYNTDSKLRVQITFNIIYENNDPDEFKNIFRLLVVGEEVEYNMMRNDTITYWISADLPKNKKELIQEDI